MCQTSVPYFTDLVIMSFKCEYCGAHSAETKNSGEVLAKASVLTLKVEQDIDLKRDLFKVYFLLFRVKHVQSIFQILSYSCVWELLEEFSQLLRDSSKRFKTILMRLTSSLIVILSSAEECQPYFKISQI